MIKTERKCNTLREWLGTVSQALLDLDHTRLLLLVVELQEEKLRGLRLIFWLSLALALALSGLIIGLVALSILLWSTAGLAGLASLALPTLVGSAGILWKIRRQIEKGTLPFAGTIAEFRKDREWRDDGD
jgi:uncharacterized membrane protein YqjE